jgi:hypothetical protein
VLGFSVERNNLLPKLVSAKEKLADAQRDLERVINEIASAPREEKTGVTPVVERAFEQVKSAREAVEELEALLLPPR